MIARMPELAEFGRIAGAEPQQAVDFVLVEDAGRAERRVALGRRRRCATGRVGRSPFGGKLVLIDLIRFVGHGVCAAPTGPASP